MNVRNKKVVLLTILSSMGIGMLTLSISKLTPKAAQESLNPINQLQATEAINKEKKKPSANSIDATAPSESAKAPIVASNHDSKDSIDTNDESKPVYEFISKTYPEIDILIQNYYLAKASADLERLKELLSDPSYAPSEDKLETEKSYVEDYGNLDCHIKRSYEEGSYIVYVYHEVKFFNIETSAPYLDKFYVITDSHGKLKIYSPEYEKELADYYVARDQDFDVQALIELTNKKIDDAISKDEQLRIYLEQLSVYFSNAEDDTKVEDETVK